MHNSTHAQKEALAFTPRTSNSPLQSTAMVLVCKENNSNLKDFLKVGLEFLLMLTFWVTFWLAIVL